MCSPSSPTQDLPPVFAADPLADCLVEQKMVDCFSLQLTLMRHLLDFAVLRLPVVKVIHIRGVAEGNDVMFQPIVALLA